MSRVIVICEGPAEQEFCKDVLAPHLANKGIYVQAPLVKKSGGGVVSWAAMKRQIEVHLKQDSTAHVTLLIDYYGISDSHQYPGWTDAHKEPDKTIRMEILEQAMQDDLDTSLSGRFVANIQLHEFEGILFSDRSVFDKNFEMEELVGIVELNKTFADFQNPEEINNNKETCPGRRLERIILGYNKIVHGAILAEEIGLKRIREKCPRFNGWIEKLEAL